MAMWRTLHERAETRRAAVLERRTGELAPPPVGGDRATSQDMSGTMRVAWELVTGLRATLLSLEERATRVVPAEVAGLIALWTQLHTFDRTAAKIFVWAAWAILCAAVLVLARLVMPRRLEHFWDSLVPPEVVLADLRPLEPPEEARIASQMSTAIHEQIERLRRGFRLAVTMSGVALVLTALGYVIDHW